VPGANKAAVDRLDQGEEAGPGHNRPQPPRNRDPENQNPRGRAVPEPRGFKWC